MVVAVDMRGVRGCICCAGNMRDRDGVHFIVQLVAAGICICVRVAERWRVQDYVTIFNPAIGSCE